MSNSIPPKGKLKRKDLGIAASVVVVTQLLSGINSNQNTAQNMEKFKDEFHKSMIEREQYFVRKADIAPVNKKLDDVNEQLIRLTEQVASLKHAVRDNYAFKLLPADTMIKKANFRF